MSFQIVETSPTHFTILFENSLWKKVSKTLFKKELRSFRFDGSIQDIEKRFNELEQKIARNYSIVLLSKKPYFTDELQKKLLQKDLSEQAVHYAINYCKKLGALKDKALAESYIQSKMKKGYSTSFAKMTLKQKAGRQVDLSDFKPSTSDEAIIKAALKKRFSKADFKDVKVKQKIYNYFLRRGFNSEQILQLINEQLVAEKKPMSSY